MPLSAEPTYQMFEYACQEGNYAIANALSGARYIERVATSGTEGP